MRKLPDCEPKRQVFDGASTAGFGVVDMREMLDDLSDRMLLLRVLRNLPTVDFVVIAIRYDAFGLREEAIARIERAKKLASRGTRRRVSAIRKDLSKMPSECTIEDVSRALGITYANAHGRLTRALERAGKAIRKEQRKEWFSLLYDDEERAQ